MRHKVTGFQKGKSGNPNGRPRISPEFKGIRKLSLNDFVLKVNKYVSLPFEELKRIFKNPEVASLDLMIISVITESIKKGDTHKIEFLLNRLIGPVKQKIDHSSEDGTMATSNVIDLSKLSNEEIDTLENVFKRQQDN